jgi:hypothetical protein
VKECEVMGFWENILERDYDNLAECYDGWPRKRRDKAEGSTHNFLEFDDNPTLWNEEEN